MRVQDLKNYGRPLNETAMRPSPGLRLRFAKDSLSVLFRRLGVSGALRTLAGVPGEIKRMSAVDLSPVREKGCRDERFIRTIVQGAAFFSSMQRVAGREQAMAVQRGIMDRAAVPMNLSVLPPASDIEAFQAQDGAFTAFRQYVMALWEADQRAGLHFFEVVEDSDSALAVNVVHCAYCQIPSLLGVPDACEAYCYSDDVFFPDFLEPMGVRFVRTQSLGRGGSCCDFRFERMNPDSAN